MRLVSGYAPSLLFRFKNDKVDIGSFRYSVQECVSYRLPLAIPFFLLSLKILLPEWKTDIKLLPLICRKTSINPKDEITF